MSRKGKSRKGVSSIGCVREQREPSEDVKRKVEAAIESIREAKTDRSLNGQPLRELPCPCRNSRRK